MQFPSTSGSLPNPPKPVKNGYILWGFFLRFNVLLMGCLLQHNSFDLHIFSFEKKVALNMFNSRKHNCGLNLKCRYFWSFEGHSSCDNVRSE